jgi:hypothetical protein
MPSFEDFLVAAKHQLKVTGHNRTICALLVTVLEELVASLVQDQSLKKEIEAMKVTRRILSKHTNIAHLASKSRKLASVQRILSDIQEFLVEYLNEGKRLTRSTAKSAYKKFYDLIVDARTSGLTITLSETEFDHAWEVDTLERFLVDEDMCLILWIDEEHVDEKTLSFFESETVMIVPCMAKQMKERFEMLKKLALPPAPASGHVGFQLSRNQTYQGRFRFVVNPRDPKRLMQRLQKKGLLSYPILLLTSNMISAGLNPTVEIQAMRSLKPDLLIGSREIDSRNFCLMSTVIWLNPLVDPETPGGPSLDMVSEARRHILTGIARHGTVVFELQTVAEFSDFFHFMNRWLCNVPALRVLVSHHNFRTLTGKEALPDYSSANITSVLLALRTKLSQPKTPVLVFSTDLAALHDSVYSLPLCKPTNSIEEAIDLGAMWPLTWVPDWSLFDSLNAEDHWAGEVTIFDVSCFNLLAHSNGHLDPYLVVNLNGNKKTRIKSKRQDHTTAPNWISLNWNFKVSSTDTLHFIMWGHDTFAKDTCLGEVLIPLRDFFKSPMPLLEATIALKPKKANAKVSGTITIKFGLSVTSKNGEDDQNGESMENSIPKNSDAIIEETRSIRIRGTHFGRPLGDSLHSAEKAGMRHIAHVCIIYIMEQGLNSVGIFRIVGNRRKVKEAQNQFDLGRDVRLDDPFVAASLLKLYLRELPDPIISSSVYKQFMALQTIATYQQLLPEMRKVLNQLSRVNRDLLADVLETLHQVAENESINLMGTRNLATTIAPTLCISKYIASNADINELLLDTNAAIDLVQVMIQYNRYMFPESPEDESLPKEIQDLAESTSAVLDRSPPSSPEQSDEEHGEENVSI